MGGHPGLANQPDDWIVRFALKFAWPLISGEYEESSPRWGRIERLFEATRRAAYLTLDCPFSGISWIPSIPAVIEQTIRRANGGVEDLVSDLAEVISPIESVTYSSIYYSDEARNATARISEAAYARLSGVANVGEEIQRWMREGLMTRLRLRTLRGTLNHIGCARIRSHFHDAGAPQRLFEQGLRSAEITHPLVSIYSPWSSSHSIDCVEQIFDAFTTAAVTPRLIGRFIKWIIAAFETLPDEHRDLQFELLRRRDLAKAYQGLLERALQISYKKVSLHLEPWDLRSLGVRAPELIGDRGIGVFAAGADLSDGLVRVLLRRPNNFSPLPGWEDRAAELDGLRELRRFLIGRMPPGGARRRWLVVPSSVQLLRDEANLLEFDGGVLELSARSGALKWWGLETKNGAGNPSRTLQRKLRRLQIDAEVFTISRKHAVAELHLDSPPDAPEVPPN